MKVAAFLLASCKDLTCIVLLFACIAIFFYSALGCVLHSVFFCVHVSCLFCMFFVFQYIYF